MSISNDLRKAVLQAAIQGKLTKQLPEDGNAKDLLEQIKAEKAKLIKDGKLKKEKSLPEITEDEKPFDIPENWEWCRLGEVFNLNMGQSPLGSSIFDGNDGVEFHQGKIHFGEMYLKPSHQITKNVTKLAKANSILLCVRAPVGVVNITEREICIGRGLCAVSGFGEIQPKFIFYFMDALKNELVQKATGTTFKAITGEVLKNQLIPFPPLSEQKRIVAKVEELMAKIDDLEKTEKELEALKKSFPADMKDALLQAAMQGKLTEHLPEDGNAKDLLEQIKAEKAKLIKEGKLKKEKPLPEINEDEKPFDIPENWEWVRLGDILLKLTDGAHSTPKYFSKGVPFISVKDVSSGNISFSDCKYISEQEHNELYKRCNPEKGDVLLTKVGTTGIPVIVDTEIEFSLFVSVALLKFNQSLLFNRYLVDLIKAPVVQKQAEVNTKGVGNKNWVMRDIANTMLPLPPFAEQKRIVEKLEKLLPLCDGLE